MSGVTVPPASWVDGVLRIPGDKSISHRVLILGAMARGRSFASNVSPAADVASTAACLEALGAGVRLDAAMRAGLDGAGTGRGWAAAESALDCGNSGTTMRLLAGAIAAHPISAVLDGDASLRRRPMERVAGPLRELGAEVVTHDGCAPMTVTGRPPIHGGEYVVRVASAQIKSAMLLAGLAADSPVHVLESMPTRDHTERLLRLCGIAVTTGVDGRITLMPGEVQPFGMRIPGDLSSAAFFLALAASRPGWRVRCEGVTLNPGRIGVLDVLRAMGADVDVEPGDDAGGVEPCGDVAIRGAALRGVRIDGALIPRCIDELPVLAVLAGQAEGVTTIRDAAELRVKESDRIALLVDGLRRFGVACEEHDDGLTIEGPCRLRGARVQAHGDHRLAMAWAVAASLVPEGGDASIIDGAECTAVSYPQFFSDLASVTQAG